MIARRGPIALLLAGALLGAAPARAEEDLEELRLGFDAIEAWRVDEARVIAEKWAARAPDHPLVLALLAEVKLHLSDYRGAVHYYEAAHDAGAPESMLASAPLALAAERATHGYTETVSAHFVVRHSPGKDAVLVPYALETLEKAMEKIGGLLGWRPTSRIVVEFYPSASTLADVSTLTKDEIRASGTIALCKWNRLMVTTPRAVVFGYSWRDTLAHELAHLILGGASKNTVPIWLHEGIAKFVETAWRDQPGLGLSVEQQKALRDAAKKGKLIPFSRMHPSMAKLKSQEETSLAFAEVFTFVEYLVQLQGWEGMRKVLAQMSAGASDADAISAVFGTPLSTLSDRWMASLKSRPFKVEGVSQSASREVIVKERPELPDDNLQGVSKEGRRFARAADLLFMRGRAKAAQKELEKAIAAAPSAVLSAKLAMVALGVGDLDAAEKAAREALEGSGDLPGPNVTLAEILIRREKHEEARVALDRAASINPFDPRIYVLLSRVMPKDQLAQVRLAQEILKAPPNRKAGLGSGAWITIEALPFSRVFLTRNGSEAGEIGAGAVTPTAPIELRPGAYMLRLVPPVGAPSEHSITVQAGSTEDTPQRIALDVQGS